MSDRDALNSLLTIGRSGRDGKDEAQLLSHLRTFLSEFTKAANHIAPGEELLSAVVEAADVIGGTGAVRLYLPDAMGTKLVWRGGFGEEQSRSAWSVEPVPLEDEKWAVTRVYRSGEFEKQEDTTDKGANVHRKLASRLGLRSSWLFPINDHTVEGQLTVGVLCLDNPCHCPDPPGPPAQQLVERMLSEVGHLIRLSGEAINHRQAMLLLELFSRLHSPGGQDQTDESEQSQWAPAPNPATRVLSLVLDGARRIRPDISAFVVRLKCGYDVPRLRAAYAWPEAIGRLLESQDIVVIDADTSVAEDYRGATHKGYPDVREASDRTGLSTLKSFIEGLDALSSEVRPDVGALLSFRLTGPPRESFAADEGEDLGTCSFFFRTPGLVVGPEDLGYLLRLVNQGAIAIANALLSERLHRVSSGLEFTHVCVKAATSGKSRTEVQAMLTRHVGSTFGARAVSFLEIEHKHGHGAILEVARETTYVSEDVLTPASNAFSFSTDEGLSGIAAQTGRPVVRSSRDEDWTSLYKPWVSGIQTCAAVPVVGRDTLTGEDRIQAIVAVESEVVEAYSKDDVAAIEKVVTEVAAAMTSAEVIAEYLKLVSELRSRLRDLDLEVWTSDVGRRMLLCLLGVYRTCEAIPSDASLLLEQLSLAEDEGSPDRSPQIAARLRDAGIRIQQLTASVATALSRHTSHSGQQVFDLGQFLKDASEAASANGETEGVAFRIPDDTFGVSVAAVRGSMEYVLAALIGNSLLSQRSAGGGQVIVSARHSGDTATIAVEDSGPGVPVEIAGSLFSEPVPSSWGGSGASLWVSGVLCALNHAEVSLERSSSSGAIFEVRLPLSSSGGGAS